MRKKSPGSKAGKGRPPKSDDEYEVGYGKPPKSTRWKQGQSGNPKGRKKGTKNFDVLLHEILMTPVWVREGNKTRKVPAVTAGYKKALEKALRGDTKAFGFLLDRYDPKAISRVMEARAVRKLDLDNMSKEEIQRIYTLTMKGGVQG